MRPVTQPIGTGYGVKGSHWAAGYHTGIDFLTPTGTQVLSATPGKVVFAGRGGWGTAYGTHVVVRSRINATKYEILYAHLSSASVRSGVQVAAGTPVGRSGATGNVTGPHLHLEVRRSPFTYRSDVNPTVALNVKPSSSPNRNRVQRANALVDQALALYADVPANRKVVKTQAAKIRAARRVMPKK